MMNIDDITQDFGMTNDELGLLVHYLGGTASPYLRGSDQMMEYEIKKEINPDIRPPFLISYATRLKSNTKRIQQLFSTHGLKLTRKESKYFGSWVSIIHY